MHVSGRSEERRDHSNRERTPSLVQPVLDSRQLRLELLVLDGKSTIRVLQERLKVLYPLVTSEQLALGDAGLFLQCRVLVHELRDKCNTSKRQLDVIATR